MNHEEYELSCKEALGDADTMLGAANMRIRTLERVLARLVDTKHSQCPVDHPAFEDARETLPHSSKRETCENQQKEKMNADSWNLISLQFDKEMRAKDDRKGEQLVPLFLDHILQDSCSQDVRDALIHSIAKVVMKKVLPVVINELNS